MQIHPLFVALILVAAASSVPDTIISVKDAKKGNYDDALSNVLGSNIFDITISMGLPLAVFLVLTNQKIHFVEAGRMLIDIRIMLLIITSVTIAIYYFSKKMAWKHVAGLGVLYGFFIVYSIGASLYYSGESSFLGSFSGAFIEFLHQDGGVSDTLRSMANSITGSW